MITPSNINAIIIGTILGITTGLVASKININFSGKNNESYIIRPVDLTLTANENIKRICHAASIGQADIQPGKIVVIKHYNTLDGQKLKVEATLSYNDDLNLPCKLALGGKAECYVVRPVDLAQAASDNIQRVCDAAGAGNAEVEPGKIIVTNRYCYLDGAHFGQELAI